VDRGANRRDVFKRRSREAGRTSASERYGSSGSMCACYYVLQAGIIRASRRTVEADSCHWPVTPSSSGPPEPYPFLLQPPPHVETNGRGNCEIQVCFST